MSPNSNLAEVAALMGDPARARILEVLADGRALTAKELAFHGRIAASTASGHLGKLVDGRLLSRVKQGRHQYFQLASPQVGAMIESVMVVAGASGVTRPGPPTRIDAAMRLARSCYDHLAGRLGVAIADGLAARGYVVLGEDSGSVTPAGIRFLETLGVALPAKTGRRPLCRPCLDWSERRPHLGGALGAAVAESCFKHHWIVRHRDSRAVAITRDGYSAFSEMLGIALTDQAGGEPRS